MKKVIVLSLLTALLPWAELCGNPIEVLDGDHLELGEVPSFGITNLVYRLHNSSGEAIRVERLSTSCACISATISSNQIPARGEVAITNKLDLSKVKGSFKRSLMVLLDNPERRIVNLYVSGTVKELFSGLPEGAITLTGSAGTSFTNSFTLTAQEASISLGMPIVEKSYGLDFAWSMTTNSLEPLSYTLTTEIKMVADDGRQSVEVLLPPRGLDARVRPLPLRFVVLPETSLVAIPDTLRLSPGTTGYQELRFMLRDRYRSLESAQVSWDPPPEGVLIKCGESGRRRKSVLVHVTVSAEAAARLLQNPAASLTFRYPSYRDVSIAFESGLGAMQKNRRSILQNFVTETVEGED